MSVRTARCLHGWPWYGACPVCAQEELSARLRWQRESDQVFHACRRLLAKAMHDLTLASYPRDEAGVLYQ